jgi:release factor glutamine methyltransferase
VHDPDMVSLDGSASLPRTVREATGLGTARLQESGSETPRLDAELLLGHILGVERSALAAHPEAPLGRGQAEAFEAFLLRRSSGEPVAYIRGLKEFYGAALVVDRRVLIPRPETETIIELALERIRSALTSSPRPAKAAPYLVWDVGTGSGAIAVAIGRELRRRRYGDAVRFHLSDLSEEAMAVATINVVAHGLADLVTFAEGDLCDALPSPRPVDLLVANLPYIPAGIVPELPIAASFEPVVALDGGPDGLAHIRRLLPQLPAAVALGGAAMLEIGSDQADALAVAVEGSLPHWSCRVYPDLGGHPRVVVLERLDA